MQYDSPPTEVGILYRACRLFEIIAMVLLGVMTFLVLLQIAGRDLFGSGWPWADELARYSGLGLVYLTIPLLLMSDRHVKVDLLSSRFTGKAAYVLHVFNEALIVLFFGLFFWGGWVFMQRASKFSTPALGMPNWLFYLPAAIGMLLFGLVALRRLLRALKGNSVAAQPAAVVTEGAAS
ncbi:MAG: TRAP transporter small permease [Propionivibrio sp.]